MRERNTDLREKRRLVASQTYTDQGWNLRPVGAGDGAATRGPPRPGRESCLTGNHLNSWELPQLPWTLPGHFPVLAGRPQAPLPLRPELAQGARPRLDTPKEECPGGRPDWGPPAGEQRPPACCVSICPSSSARPSPIRAPDTDRPPVSKAVGGGEAFGHWKSCQSKGEGGQQPGVLGVVAASAAEVTAPGGRAAPASGLLTSVAFPHLDPPVPGAATAGRALPLDSIGYPF